MNPFYLIQRNDREGSTPPIAAFDTMTGVTLFVTDPKNRVDAPVEYQVTHFVGGRPRQVAFTGFNSTGRYLTKFRPVKETQTCKA